jgi:hypothetical protein
VVCRRSGRTVSFTIYDRPKLPADLYRLALNGAFGIYYFINDEDDKPLNLAVDYMLTPTIAGAHYIFAAPVEVCDNCGRQEEQAHIVSNTAAITSLLLDYKEVQPAALPSLTPEHVVPFLKKRLRWRVYDVCFYPLREEMEVANFIFSSKEGSMIRDGWHNINLWISTSVSRRLSYLVDLEMPRTKTFQKLLPISSAGLHQRRQSCKVSCTIAEDQKLERKAQKLGFDLSNRISFIY